MTVSVSKDPARIARMFDAIARRYDTLNHLLSAGFDRRWRRKAVDALGFTGRERVLDMCTGTGDLAIEAVTSRAGQAAEVVGADFSSEMLHLAAGKVRRAGLASRIRLLRGDATSVPFANGTFDAAMVAFGIRNVLDPDAACREFHRVLRSGGRLAILEFGAPRLPGLRTLYLSYFRYVLPAIGRLVSKHQDAYEYLPASVMAFPTGEAFASRLRDAGFSTATFRRLMGGIVYLYVAVKD
ncbi:MAG TPA: bifunctional demethylmenaquinone methyltransferase/2-methoxy-6-polyprenyl-1,4-benzoquinol methylase UbiE [Vicinamibacterales bacterium]|nr:bifunctional demethylmenaquinone methyltransferase/2-methoxy-6-polyprenyl-1,4-benzoquinol methylase UbiE [Vicinamibacterales bacterium]